MTNTTNPMPQWGDSTGGWEAYLRRQAQRNPGGGVAALIAELDALRAFKAGVPWMSIADVIDHYRAGLPTSDVNDRLNRTIIWLMDNTDWLPALDTDQWRAWRLRHAATTGRCTPMSDKQQCPFCGNSTHFALRGKQVLCIVCGGEGPDGRSGPDGTAGWNARFAEDALRAERDAALVLLHLWLDLLNAANSEGERWPGAWDALKATKTFFANTQNNTVVDGIIAERDAALAEAARLRAELDACAAERYALRATLDAVRSALDTHAPKDTDKEADHED